MCSLHMNQYSFILMEVQVGTTRFISQDKSSRIVQVIEDEHKLTYMPRENAEALYRTLISAGAQAAIDRVTQDGLGGYITTGRPLATPGRMHRVY